MGMKKRFKQRETDVIKDGIVYRLTEEGEYGVYTYTAELPEEVTVVPEVNSIPVTALLDGCFSDSPLTRVQLPSSLKVIENGAFRGCKELTELKVPDDVHTVGGAVFKNCKGLKRLEFGRHTKELGWNLCEGCKSIEDFILWDEVEYIGSNLFWSGGKHLRYTEYSYGMYLGNPDNPYILLYGNVRIDPPQEGEKIIVDIHPNTKFITGGAFNRFWDGAVDFADLDEVTIHDGVLQIDAGAFSFGFMGRNGVKTVRADSLETLCRVGGSLLAGSGRLLIDGKEITDLVIPGHIREIADHTFSYCNWLKSVVFEGEEVDIGSNAFDGAARLTEVKFPEKVKYIGMYAFWFCRSLQNLELYAVEEIMYEAFQNTGLKSVVFHGPVGEIYHNAFTKNPHLKTVIGLENVKAFHPVPCDPFAETPLEGIYVRR